MRIGEPAHRAGVSPRALRYYEEQGLITAERDHNGYRVYDGDAVLLVRDIARLLHAGLSSEDVLRFVDCLGQGEPDPPRDCVALLRTFSERLGALDERIAALTGARERLAAETDRLAKLLEG
ncbi:MerR family DNA-binding transcriptional regulator [Nonomuraea terrae]|uniref:MerR family DNA-binding transcriptional regulator n=1 Tax=Nonomuraea terrae TaxID=2530383 RepID=A0A4R4YS84_9ACTN|nr:MerR family DNA-binding transcriptional regulator [Nonomuraea terrae]TDD48086.1 MerR family DNA-binding transcriptional regulator [Nonomuraea terrae]